MPEDEIVDILDLILESIKLIRERFSRIKLADDFVSTAEGVTLLDAICMRLQVIGESVKQGQKIDPSFLEQYLDYFLTGEQTLCTLCTNVPKSPENKRGARSARTSPSTGFECLSNPDTPKTKSKSITISAPTPPILISISS